LPGLPAIDLRDLGNLFCHVAAVALLSYLLLDQLIRSPIGIDRDSGRRGLGGATDPMVSATTAYC